MKKKTKQDFQELLKTEHCKKTLLCLCIMKVTSALQHMICPVMFFLVLDTNVFFSVPALLEGFELRECISFIEEHINRQVR